MSVLAFFYDNLSSCWLDLGNEIDNYHLAYRRYQAEAGDLDYYLFLGPKVLDVTKAFVRLTGKTQFGPKWSLGYSGSTMHYTDAPDAQVQLQSSLHCVSSMTSLAIRSSSLPATPPSKQALCL